MIFDPELTETINSVNDTLKAAADPDSCIYDSARASRHGWEELLEIVQRWDLLWLVTVNSIKTRYRRSYLGLVWTLLNPLLYTAVIAIAFSALFKFQIPNYPLYLLNGMITYNFFTQGTLMSVSALVWGGGLLKKIYVPKTIFIISSIGNALFTLAISLFVLLLLSLVMRQPLSASLWFVPIAVLIITLFTMGMALIISSLGALFTDFVDIYQVLLHIWFYLTPIMYPIDIVPTHFRWIIVYNPLYHLVQLLRGPIFDGCLPDGSTILAATLSTVAVFVIGWKMFTKNAHQLAYRL